MWKLIKEIILSFITAISGLIPILAFLGINNVDDFILKLSIYKYSKYIVIVSIILFIGVSIGNYLYNSNKIKSKYEKLHTIFHNIRNYKLKDSYIIKTTENIASYINCLSLKRFHVSIKTFEFKDDMCYDSRDLIQDLNLCTIARAGADENRCNNESEKKHKVQGNTDFCSVLFDKECNIFSCSNLWMLKWINRILTPSQQYRNTDNQFLKKYLTSIVIPIRINKDKFADEYKNKKCVFYNNYIVTGFLCIDCKRPISRVLKNEITGAAKAIADSMFVPLFDNINCDKC